MKTENKNEITALLIDYCSNSIPALTIVEKLNASEIHEENICQILGDFQRDWNALECDPEGFTKAQEKEADDLLDDVVQDLSIAVAMGYSEEESKYRIIDYCQNWSCKNKLYGNFDNKTDALTEITRLAHCVIEETDLSSEEEKEILNFARLGHFDHDGHYYKIEEIES